MATLMLTVGLPGSGKSYWARKMRELRPQTVLVSKDEIRAMLFDSVYSKDNEQITVLTEEQIVKQALSRGRDVIVHNTHLNPSHIRRLEKVAHQYKADFKVIEQFLSVPVEVCIKQDATREGKAQVGEGVIRDMINRWFKEGQWIGLKEIESWL